MRDFDDFNRWEEHAWRTECEMELINRAQNGDAEAQYQMGCWHGEGGARIVEKDAATAAEWFGKAAAQGHADAQKKLKEMNK